MNFRIIDIHKDRETIIKFRKDSYVISFGDSSGFGDEEVYINRIKNRIEKLPEGMVIVEEDTKAIGMMELQITTYNQAKIGYVNLFYLIPEFRNKGLGKNLILYAERVFGKNNIEEYHLRVSPTNKRAIHFYLKNGMEKISEEIATFLVWRMRKYL